MKKWPKQKSNERESKDEIIFCVVCGKYTKFALLLFNCYVLIVILMIYYVININQTEIFFLVLREPCKGQFYTFWVFGAPDFRPFILFFALSDPFLLFFDPDHPSLLFFNHFYPLSLLREQ